ADGLPEVGILALDRPVPDFHGVGPAGDLDDRRAGEGRREPLRVDGRGGDDHLQVRAAGRRGWVWPIWPSTPRPSSRQILGIWVVLPEPVSPAMITTWWSRMAARISSLRWLTGSSAGYEIGGMAARRAARAKACPACGLERRVRGRAGEDVTGLDSIPAGRIDQIGPYRIT